MRRLAVIGIILGGLLVGAKGQTAPEPPVAADTAPRVGDPTPALDLVDLDGRVVRLEDLRGRPVVLVFGSSTSPIFRRNVDTMNALQREYGEGIRWLVVYTREAHASDSPPAIPANAAAGIDVPRHRSFAERLARATAARDAFGIRVPIVVDDLRDSAAEAFRGVPNRAYVLDGQGRIVSVQPWFDPRRTEHVLEELEAGGSSHGDEHGHAHDEHGEHEHTDHEHGDHEHGATSSLMPLTAHPHEADVNGPCVCDVARATGGWCGRCGVGHVAAVRIESAMLFEQIDAHGHVIDPQSIDCPTCRSELDRDGFCETCDIGFVDGQLYASRLSYAIACGQFIDLPVLSCPTCRSLYGRCGWCPTCAIGIVGNTAYTTTEAYRLAARAYANLLRAVEASRRCEMCGLAVFTHSRCPRCDRSYPDPDG